MSNNNKLWFVFILLASVAYCAVESDGEGDFYIFLSASAWLDGHTNIYVHKYLQFYHYYYSVFFALLLKPFYYLPYYGVKFCWLIFNLSLYYHLFYLLAKSGYVTSLPHKQKRLFLTGTFILSFRFLHENLHTSQITILILWCCIYGLYRVYHKKELSGSFLLALGINIKLLPLVVLPYLLYRGFFKAFFCTVGIYLLLMFLPGIFIGNAYNLQLLNGWFQLINPANAQHIMDVDERSFHSLTTLLTTLFIEHPPDPLAMPFKRNIMDVTPQTLAYIINGVRLLLIGFTLYFLLLPPFKRISSVKQIWLEISYLLLLVPLIFPHQQNYAFLFAVPAFIVALYAILITPAKNTKGRRVAIYTLVLAYLLCNLKLLLGEFKNYYEHYKILTYGALLLIPLLIWVARQPFPASPSRLKEEGAGV